MQKIYDIRDDFVFDIVNSPFLDGDVPRRPYIWFIYLKPLKTQRIKMLFFSFITKSHTLFMFKPASLSHGNVKAKHERHCALRLKILVKNVKIVTFLFNPSQILKLYTVSM